MQTKLSLFPLIFLLLTACDYQLRGASKMPEGMRNVYVENGSGPLRREIQKALKFSKGKLVVIPKTAGVVIKILKERMKIRVLSVSSTGKANQFELIYKLEFSIYDPDGKVLLANQRVQSQRSYFNDQEDILAQSSEEQLIRNEMYSQAVQSIIIRSRIALENNAKKADDQKEKVESKKTVKD